MLYLHHFMWLHHVGRLPELIPSSPWLMHKHMLNMMASKRQRIHYHPPHSKWYLRHNIYWYYNNCQAGCNWLRITFLPLFILSLAATLQTFFIMFNKLNIHQNIMVIFTIEIGAISFAELSKLHIYVFRKIQLFRHILLNPNARRYFILPSSPFCQALNHVATDSGFLTTNLSLGIVVSTMCPSRGRPSPVHTNGPITYKLSYSWVGECKIIDNWQNNWQIYNFVLFLVKVAIDMSEGNTRDECFHQQV